MDMDLLILFLPNTEAYLIKHYTMKAYRGGDV
jgi:hypothetical protein